MRLKVIVDNNTIIDEYYWGEPGVCYYIEDGEEAFLFDVGYSDLFIKNATAMNIDLNKINTLVLSHGHDDHTRGLKSLLDIKRKQPFHIIAHPDALNYKEYNGLKISIPFTRTELAESCQLKLTRTPVKVTENITFLGEIPRVIDFEKAEPIGKQQVDDELTDDYLLDDSALVYQGEAGIFIITGCSHSGICNIIEYAKAVTGDHRVRGVIGGFHLFEVNGRVVQTIDYFKNHQIEQIYPCHCTTFAVKAAIHSHIPVGEVGVGLELYW
ncbi:MBL fold metallo-hydrolase [Acetobacterium sp. K1/6]|jgi:Metal-dependent hydrolases of the beta-lactamase superfamily II|uniref:MBL fold metallo-hydrolase n=1 Tax=Acetobacterium sp. K1/6 TaxID=3055467 RepID=UPI002AC9F6DA|nr:MBL fold metallo-hydrolase [Acetobacterium sp. K1/6]MDZ5723598.1 MBL fold metallo-hydrolase [Acetobacterium sp. K1/6]